MTVGNLLFIILCFSNLKFSNASWYDQFVGEIKNFLSKSEHTIRQEWETRKEDVKVAIEKTKIALGNVVTTIGNNGEKIKSKFLRTAETTLKGAGDEKTTLLFAVMALVQFLFYFPVESFFSEVPKTVDSGFRGLATKAEEGVSWIFRNIICPILCCGCCLSQCINSINDQLQRYFKRKRSRDPRVIVLKGIDPDDPKDHLV
uniref:Tryptophan-rich basic protein n=1 Tax=Syphacia muris TaxID=451379 RepID=A0A0N5AJU0_9BILA